MTGWISTSMSASYAGELALNFEYGSVSHLYLYRRVCVCLSVCLSVCVSFRRYTRRRLWSDRDQILHTHADSSPNGSEQNKNQPRVTQGGFGGVLGGQKFTNLE